MLATYACRSASISLFSSGSPGQLPPYFSGKTSGGMQVNSAAFIAACSCRRPEGVQGPNGEVQSRRLWLHGNPACLVFRRSACCSPSVLPLPLLRHGPAARPPTPRPPHPRSTHPTAKDDHALPHFLREQRADQLPRDRPAACVRACVCRGWDAGRALARTHAPLASCGRPAGGAPPPPLPLPLPQQLVIQPARAAGAARRAHHQDGTLMRKARCRRWGKLTASTAPALLMKRKPSERRSPMCMSPRSTIL